MKIQKTNDIKSSRISIITYGPFGVGKTSLTKTLSKPLVLSGESGLLSLSDSSIDYVEINSTKDLDDALIELNSDELKKKYNWIVLDSLTELAEKIVESLEAKHGKRMDLQMWGFYNRALLRYVKTLRDFSPYNILITANEDHILDDNKKLLEIRPDLQGQKVAGDVGRYFDQVLYYNFNKNGERVILTRPRNNIVAKDRSGKLDEFEKPDLSAIVEKIRGKK